jgi:tRNA uridine 5-carbamoylmethylation protein Kti12
MSKLIIMQGIAGSGKSRVARRLLGAQKESGVCGVIASADDYPDLYDKSGGFHPELLGEAHKACFRTALQAVLTFAAALRPRGAIVVDNTNLTALEMAPYVALGAAYEIPVEIVRVLCPQPVAYARQTHGVPLAAHRGMARRLKSFTIPPYWDVKVREVRTGR